MYWGHWPKTWQQWPQKRPDIWFPQGQGKEIVPAPQGTVPEKLPQEEPFVSPTAPGGDYLPPIGEGPATGPGDFSTPFDLNQGFDQGPGFDQKLPAMDNLPETPPAPHSLPIEGVDDNGAATIPTAPPATETPLSAPPATETPATEAPAPDSGSADESPADSVLSQQQPLPANSLNSATDGERRPTIKADRQTEKTRLSPLAANVNHAPQTSDINPSARMPKFEPVEENPYEPIAPEPGDTCLSLKTVADAATDTANALPAEKAFHSSRQDIDGAAPTPDNVVRRTAFETKELEAKTPVEETFAEPLPEVIDEHAAMAEEKLAPQTNLAPVPPAGSAERVEALPLGLDGYCPVELVRHDAWAQGDSRYAVEFAGRTYLMSGPEQHRAFRSNPERYAPVNSGFDPVLSFEENVREAGRTDACAVFEGRLYMFAGPDSLARFQSDPHRYARAILKESQR